MRFPLVETEEVVMSLPDPITIAARAPTPALVFRVVRPTPKLDGLYRVSDDGAYNCTITHAVPLNGTERHYLRIGNRKAVTSPSGVVSTQESYVSINAAFFSYGWTAAEKAALIYAAIDTILDAEVTIPSFVNQQS